MNGASFATLYPADKSNYTAGRSAKISEITVHHMGGINSAEGCGAIFATKGRNGSAHYGIGYDGKIGQYVDEGDTSWANSNWESNCRAVTIEVSNCERKEPWKVSGEAYQSLIKLVADIAMRNGITLVKGKTLTWHSMYAATACPGDYLRERMDDIVEKANKIIEESTPADWSKEAVEWAVKNGILKGDENGNLKLRDNCTREQLVTMLYRAVAK